MTSDGGWTDALGYVFLTPDGAMWDPHSLHFAEEEAAMVDADGAIVQQTISNAPPFDGSRC